MDAQAGAIALNGFKIECSKVNRRAPNGDAPWLCSIHI